MYFNKFSYKFIISNAVLQLAGPGRFGPLADSAECGQADLLQLAIPVRAEGDKAEGHLFVHQCLGGVTWVWATFLEMV